MTKPLAAEEFAFIFKPSILLVSIFLTRDMFWINYIIYQGAKILGLIFALLDVCKYIYSREVSEDVFTIVGFM